MFWNKKQEKQPEKLIEIRGFRFTASKYNSVTGLLVLYFTLKASEGDALAGEILDKFFMVIRDADGKQIYPPKG